MRESREKIDNNVAGSWAQSLTSPYDVLGVRPDASTEVLKAALRTALDKCSLEATLGRKDPYATIRDAGEAIGIPHDYGDVGAAVVEVSRNIRFLC